MFELEVSQLSDVEQYMVEVSSIYFKCILKNEAEGIVWGNRKNSPEFLVVWSPYQEGFQLMGKPIKQNEWKQFRDWFLGTIIPFLKQQGISYFEYGADTKELEDMFKKIFADTDILSESQRIYCWSGFKETIPQPIGYEIKKVDREFLQDTRIDKSFIVEEIKKAYGDLNLIEKSGIAYVAIYKDTVIARADMLFSSDGQGNISVSTQKEHRKKGISSYLVMQTIADTLKKGLEPIWDCTDDNVASDKTATKCGFQMIRKDTISWFNVIYMSI